MREQVYDLTPWEDIHDIDGHLLVLVYNPTDLLESRLESLMTHAVCRLGESAEFFYSAVDAKDYPHMTHSMDTPTLTHYFSGVEKHSCSGVDDIREWFDWFVARNKNDKQ